MQNIVITGFMGTGKSSVGRVVAAALRMTFIDMDEAIAAREGRSIAEIFAARGEPAFRDLESAFAAELGRRDGLVVATGGGALLRPENRVALGANSLVICLRCAPDEIVRRLEHDEGRPLLATPDRAARIASLLADRAPVYDALPIQIDTTGKTIEAVAAAIVGRYRREGCRSSAST